MASTLSRQVYKEHSSFSTADGKFPKQVTADNGSLVKVLPPPPKSWPIVPELFRKPSCLQTSSRSTCVNKAASHLELLQTIIEEWMGKEQARATKQHREKNSTPAKGRRTPEQSRLAVEGEGIVLPADIAAELPYLGADEVIGEVITLLARLDNDRIETGKVYQKEVGKGHSLQKAIDDLAARKAIEFPLAIQKEHQASVDDLNEMTWHVTYAERNEEKINGRVETAETYYNRLKNEIGFVAKHCPLVEEKLHLELDSIQKIKTAQEQATEELCAAREKLTQTKDKNRQAHLDAEQERADMKQKVKEATQALKDISEKEAEERLLHNSYQVKLGETEQQIEDNREEYAVLTVRLENARAAEGLQNTLVEGLQDRLGAQENIKHRLQGTNTSLAEELEVVLSTSENQATELNKAIEHMKLEITAINRYREELIVKTEEYTRVIKTCDKKLIEDEKSLRRLNNQIAESDLMMGSQLEELAKVQSVNSAIREQLQDEKERCSHIEDQLRTQLDTLKKQVRDEIHMRSKLAANISSDGAELVKTKTETKKKKAKMAKTVKEMSQAIKIVEEKVDHLTGVFREKSKTVLALSEELDRHLAEKERVNEEYKKDREVLDPELAELKIEKEALRVNTEQITHEIEMMTKKRNENTKSTQLMLRNIARNEEASGRLEKELTEVKIRLATEKEVSKNLQQNLKDNNLRLTRARTDHKKLLVHRLEVRQSYKDDLQSDFQENKGLAARYRYLQNQYMHVKNHLMDLYDQANRMEASIRDLKQLEGLQKRMHVALTTYYKFRGKYNSEELHRVNIESHNTAIKVGQLQDQFESALDTITNFFQYFVSVSQARGKGATSRIVTAAVAASSGTSVLSNGRLTMELPTAHTCSSSQITCVSVGQ